MEKKEFKHIVRIGDADIPGNKNLISGLRKIKGVSFMISNAICTLSKINKNSRIGELSDTDVARLNSLVKDISNSGTPEWMFNRQNDPESADDKHLVTSDLRFAQDNDIKQMQKMKSYRGTRHYSHLPVRGQKTKSNFRKNKGKVTGVKKKKGAKTGK